MGNYEITFFFARPEVALLEDASNKNEELLGDSALIITTPEPRDPQDPVSIIVTYNYTAINNKIKTGDIVFHPNKYGRLCSATTTLYADSYCHARNEAYKALLPMLSNFSFNCDVPLEIKKTITIEKSSGGTNQESRFRFPFNHFSSSENCNHPKEIYAIQSFYREGMNSANIFYSFLCFYRALESIYKMRENIIKKKALRPKFSRTMCITENDLKILPKYSDRYWEFIGRKFRDIYENELTPLRIKIAHGLFGESDPFTETPDDIDLRNKANYLILITKILARCEILSELSVQYIPKDT